MMMTAKGVAEARPGGKSGVLKNRVPRRHAPRPMLAAAFWIDARALETTTLVADATCLGAS
jgi:hypothetical protein